LLVPDAAGIYGWWFRAQLRDLPVDGTLNVGDYRLLYVGIARSGLGSASTLRRRIGRDHLGNRLATSTLRRSLAVLLAGELSFEVSRNHRGKLAMAANSESVLNEWLAKHAAISFLVNEAPWQIEDGLIREGRPSLPLNIKGSNHPFRQILSGMRKNVAGLNLP
jgi:hypothetical protein